VKVKLPSKLLVVKTICDGPEFAAAYATSIQDPGVPGVKHVKILFSEVSKISSPLKAQEVVASFVDSLNLKELALLKAILPLATRLLVYKAPSFSMLPAMYKSAAAEVLLKVPTPLTISYEPL